MIIETAILCPIGLRVYATSTHVVFLPMAWSDPHHRCAWKEYPTFFPPPHTPHTPPPISRKKAMLYEPLRATHLMLSDNPVHYNYNTSTISLAHVQLGGRSPSGAHAISKSLQWKILFWHSFSGQLFNL